MPDNILVQLEGLRQFHQTVGLTEDAALITDAASTIRALAKMCAQSDFVWHDGYGNLRCHWYNCSIDAGHEPDCPYIVNRVEELAGGDE